MKAIVAVDQNNGIGYKGDLLIKIPNDLKRFKELTTNHVLIMGRKTFESLPNSKPLPNRVHIVLTQNKDFKVDDGGVLVAHSVDKLKILLDKFFLDAYVIGGAEIYKLLLPLCDTIHLTRIYKEFENVDAYFPKLHINDYIIEDASDFFYHDGIMYNFCKYKKISSLL